LYSEQADVLDISRKSLKAKMFLIYPDFTFA